MADVLPSSPSATFYTLAVWSMQDRGSWAPIVTSDKLDWMQALHRQFSFFIWWPCRLIEVAAPATDDDVVRALRASRRPSGWSAADVADRIATSQESRVFADLVHPPGSPEE